MTDRQQSERFLRNRTIKARAGWLGIRSGRTDVPNNRALGTFFDTQGCFQIRQFEIQDLLFHARAQIWIASLTAAPVSSRSTASRCLSRTLRRSEAICDAFCLKVPFRGSTSVTNTSVASKYLAIRKDTCLLSLEEAP